jgi:hypothetical protein
MASQLGVTSLGDLTTSVTGIGGYLSSRRLAIPDYQRSYSWSVEDEVRELWEDLRTAIASDQSEYFLGAIVVIRGDETHRTQVIDGQQRLATISLMYAALRDIYASRSDERATEIERDLLGKKDRATRDLTQFLTLNAEDNEYFRQLTLKTPADRTVPPSTASHKRLQEAFDFAGSRFNETIGGLSPQDWPTPLVRWDKFVFDRAMIIEVSVPNESRGFVIFETLNDRGLNLSTADLLKNHLLGTAGGRIEEAKSRWTRAAAPFFAPDSGLDMEVFLRQFWASKKGVVRVKDLFWQMKSEVSNAEQAVALAGELAEASRLWTAMFDRDSDVWQGYPKAAVTALDTLQNLKVEQCRPLLLAALRKLPPANVATLLRLVVNWSVRWIVVGGGSAGTTERLYAEAARKVSDGEFGSVADVVSFFDSAVPSDLALQQAFARLSVYRGWLARYYLRALERAATNTAEPELVPNEDVDQVNLEHVLPRNARPQDWPAFSAEELDLLATSLGNQCLIPRSVNTTLGNRPFRDKKASLAASAFLLTASIGQSADWTPAEIRARADDLANRAPQVWPKT